MRGEPEHEGQRGLVAIVRRADLISYVGGPYIVRGADLIRSAECRA
jgi:hypothetical protein